MLRRRATAAGGGAVVFALVAFGLAGLGVGVVSDGDEGGLVHGIFEPFVACSVEGVGEVGDDLGSGFCGGKFDGLGFHRFPDKGGGFVG